MTGCASPGLPAENPLALGLVFLLANCSFIERFLEFDQLPASGVVYDFVVSRVPVCLKNRSSPLSAFTEF